MGEDEERVMGSFDFYAGFFWGWLVAAVIVGRNRNTWRKAAEGWRAAAGSWMRGQMTADEAWSSWRASS